MRANGLGRRCIGSPDLRLPLTSPETGLSQVPPVFGRSEQLTFCGVRRAAGMRVDTVLCVPIRFSPPSRWSDKEFDRAQPYGTKPPRVIRQEINVI